MAGYPAGCDGDIPLSAPLQLGDIPNAGYSTDLQKQTTDTIMFYMRGVERDRVQLLAIVMDGIEKFRKLTLANWKGLAIDRDIVDSVWRYFAMQAMPTRFQQRLLQEPKRFDKILKLAMPDIEAQAAALDQLELEKKWSPFG